MLYIPLLIGNMQRAYLREFPGGPVVSRQAFTAVGPGSIPGWGTKIPKAKKKKKKGEKTKALHKADARRFRPLWGIFLKTFPNTTGCFL